MRIISLKLWFAVEIIKITINWLQTNINSKYLAYSYVLWRIRNDIIRPHINDHLLLPNLLFLALLKIDVKKLFPGSWFYRWLFISIKFSNHSLIRSISYYVFFNRANLSEKNNHTIIHSKKVISRRLFGSEFCFKTGLYIRVERFGWVFKKFWKFNIA